MAMDGMMLPPPAPPLSPTAPQAAPVTAGEGGSDFHAMVSALAASPMAQGGTEASGPGMEPAGVTAAQAAAAALAHAPGGGGGEGEDASAGDVADGPADPAPTAPDAALVTMQQAPPQAVTLPAPVVAPPSAGAAATAKEDAPGAAVTARTPPHGATLPSPSIGSGVEGAAGPVGGGQGRAARGDPAGAAPATVQDAAGIATDAMRDTAPPAIGSPEPVPSLHVRAAPEHDASCSLFPTGPAGEPGARPDVAAPELSLAPTTPATAPQTPLATGDAAPPRAFPPAPVRQVAQVAIALAVREEDDATLSVALDPVELGRVEIAIERQGATAQIRVLAERPDTLALLQRDQRELDRLLGQAGIGAEGRSMSFGLSAEGGGGFARDGQPQRRGDGGGVPARPAMPERGAAPRSIIGLLDIAI